ncbi:Gfo/Idh/MocA family oxidoreductase [Alteromonas sp. KUL49]|uniref:Gfo/Idh/MocA family protein n=1 Tax=Alteromonas sp. KUL49 TaxID=2480798 RepID=UPI00102EE44F|nr:Gfo/Idh/MocA family oxidoreductase [Alteromonas sp. KUL49]TAP37304.1 Gfo/Idh/MocA family oxidoreductase [Alteromonas sp. KUL49]GEA12925.1 oxidoreductase [Alteromonas sp. KUL49]
MIKWGILGCGDVAEVKSGPAFNKAQNSELIAVMRRNAYKAKDFAARHKVPFWYNTIDGLLKNSDLDAIYVASPPVYHEEHAIAALQHGKHVYLEKPMAMDTEACKRIVNAAQASDKKLSIAHYRRALPSFVHVAEMLEANVIGDVRSVSLTLLKQPPSYDIDENSFWRINPDISGGGLFHDLAPHQLDLMIQYFGAPEHYVGISSNQAQLSRADDTVSALMRFPGGIHFQGNWCFSVNPFDETDHCKIIGTKGHIVFSFFDTKVTVVTEQKDMEYTFEHPENVQLPMIQRVTDYFMGKRDNPCSGVEATRVIQIMSEVSRK